MLKFLLLGDWSRSQVSVDWTANTRRVVPEVENAIEIAWPDALARPGVNLFDGPMCRVESWIAQRDRLLLRLSTSSYKTFLGTNMVNPQFAVDFGADVMANPLGVSPALVTCDEHLLLGRRNASVAYYPNRIHPFAGSMEPTDTDPFASVYRELAEELSLENGEISELHCVGIAQDKTLVQPEMMFLAAANLSRSQIQARLDPTEHHSIWSIPATAAAIEQALAEEKQLTPVAIASLLLWGRLNVGQEWFVKHSS